MSVFVWKKAALLLALCAAVLAGCERTPESEWTLQQAGDKLYEVRGVFLGDVFSVAFGPFPQADWLVILPAETDTTSLETLGAFGENHAEAFADLVGHDAPFMALVKSGEVIERFRLDPPYRTDQPLVKRADMVAGVQAARHAGTGRTYEIRRIH